MKALLLTAPALFLSTLASNAALTISEIDLANNKIEIVNTGVTVENLTGFWLCNLWQGNPVYIQVLSTMIVAGESSTGTLTVPIGGLVTLQSTAAFVTDLRGEIGFYMNGNNFGDPANMADYVSWGGNAVRDDTAALIGIWAAGTSVSVTGIAPGQTIQLKQGEDGNSFSDYQLTGSTIGFNQIPEPASALLAGVGLLALARRRRR